MYMVGSVDELGQWDVARAVRVPRAESVLLGWTRSEHVGRGKGPEQ